LPRFAGELEHEVKSARTRRVLNAKMLHGSLPEFIMELPFDMCLVERVQW
jgi:hypothetical protein